jgi:hypothetical protein
MDGALEASLIEQHSHLLQSNTEPALDRAERHTKLVRDLAVGKTTKIRKLNRMALIGWQRAKRFAYLFRVKGDPHLLLDVDALVDPVLCALHRRLGYFSRAGPPQPIDSAVMHDGE